MPFGTFLGWLFFEEILDINSLFGAVLIVLAGFIILRSKVIPEQLSETWRSKFAVCNRAVLIREKLAFSLPYYHDSGFRNFE